MKSILKTFATLALTLILGTLLPQASQAQSTLRIGDSVAVFIAGVGASEQAQVNRQYQVDERGYVKLPYLDNPIQAVGRTPAQLARSIESAYKNNQIYLNPTITINAQSQARFINVMGEVRSPQRVPYTEDLTLLNAISACGGFSPYAKENAVRLIRGEHQKEFNIKAIKKDPRLDVRLKPGDQIVVDLSPW